MPKYEPLGLFDDNRNHAEYDRIDWDGYFMNVAYLIAMRSHDSETKHGTCLVRNNRIISTGFNGFPPGSPDEIIPNKRPSKYPFVNHSETSAIINAARIGVSIEDCTAYITGYPCSNCARQLVSAGITEWVVGQTGYVSDEKDVLLRDFWIEHFKVKIRQFDGPFLLLRQGHRQVEDKGV